MATCDDCVHSGICAIQLEPHYVLDRAQKLMRESNNVEHECLSFKDRSRFIELPCKVGDTAYIIHSYKDYEGFIQEVTVSGIHLRDTIGYRNIPRAEYLVVRGNVNLSKHIKLKEIGKTVFFTREEAKQALKERE